MPNQTPFVCVCKREWSSVRSYWAHTLARHLEPVWFAGSIFALACMPRKRLEPLWRIDAAKADAAEPQPEHLADTNAQISNSVLLMYY